MIEEHFADIQSKQVPGRTLSRNQRQEVYEFLPDQVLYLKVSKISRGEREFIREFKNSARTLRIYPPRQEKELQYSDITFWSFIQQFASSFVIVMKDSEEGDEDAKNHLRRAHQFIQMLPFNYVKNRKLSISW